MKRRTVRFTATAREHVQHLERWWQENSPHPEILAEDLQEPLGREPAAGVGSCGPQSTTAAGVKQVDAR